MIPIFRQKKKPERQFQGSPGGLLTAFLNSRILHSNYFWGNFYIYIISQIIRWQLTWMLRTSLRSVSGPSSRHVRLSCLARPGALSLRQFHRISVLRTDSVETKLGTNSFDASTEPSVPLPHNVCPPFWSTWRRRVLTECVCYRTRFRRQKMSLLTNPINPSRRENRDSSLLPYGMGWSQDKNIITENGILCSTTSSRWKC